MYLYVFWLNARAIANQTLAVNKSESKLALLLSQLDSLSTEYAEKLFCVQTKQCAIKSLKTPC